MTHHLEKLNDDKRELTIVATIKTNSQLEYIVTNITVCVHFGFWRYNFAPVGI